jgi:hypothetical protein
MSVDPQYIQVGMDVVGSDGEPAGTIKEVRSADFLLNRPLARDVYVPLEAVHAIVSASASHGVNPHIVLVIRADSIGIQDWPRPS